MSTNTNVLTKLQTGAAISAHGQDRAQLRRGRIQDLKNAGGTLTVQPGKNVAREQTALSVVTLPVSAHVKVMSLGSPHRVVPCHCDHDPQLKNPLK